MTVMMYSTNAAQAEEGNKMSKRIQQFLDVSQDFGRNSYIIVFVAIFIVYALTTNGLTWSGMMNVFRHSAVIGIIGLGMGLICITGEIDLSCWFHAGFRWWIFCHYL